MAFGNSLYKALKSSNVWRPLLFPSFSGIASFNSRASSRGPKGQRDYTITHSDFVEWDISSPSSYKLFRWEPPRPYKLKTDCVYVNSPHPDKPCCWEPRPYKLIKTECVYVATDQKTTLENFIGEESFLTCACYLSAGEWDICSPISYKLFRWEPPRPYKLKTDCVYVNSPHPYKPCCWEPRPYKLIKTECVYVATDQKKTLENFIGEESFLTCACYLSAGEWDICSPISYKLFRWEPPRPYKLKTDCVYVNSPHPYKPCCWEPRPYKPCCCVYDKMEIDKPCCCVYDKMESRFR